MFRRQTVLQPRNGFSNGGLKHLAREAWAPWRVSHSFTHSAKVSTAPSQDPSWPTALERLRTQSGRGGKLITTIPVPTRAPHIVVCVPKNLTSLAFEMGKKQGSEERRDAESSLGDGLVVTEALGKLPRSPAALPA